MTLTDVQMRAYREARREGMPIRTALYVARPPVLELDWDSHYQADGEWAFFELDGRRYKVVADDPQRVEGTCASCAELVEAYKRQDDDYAWMTPEEYDATEHRFLTVYVVDEDDEETAYSGSLWGTCGTRNTPTQRRLDDRYVAETAVDLAHEALVEWERAEVRKRAAKLAEETRFGELIEELTAYAETLAAGLITRSEYFDRAARLVGAYKEGK